jgi:hypothetical protein
MRLFAVVVANQDERCIEVGHLTLDVEEIEISWLNHEHLTFPATSFLCSILLHFRSQTHRDHY